MKHSPGHSPQDTPDDPQCRLPVPLEGDKNGGARRVVDAEVVDEQETNREHGRQNSSIWGGDGPDGNSGSWSSGDSRGFFYSRTFGAGGGSGFGRVWTTAGQGQNACLAPCITFALFMVCLVQFGFLAALGFVFFHTIGSVMGTLRDLRRLGEGFSPQPWAWRIGNWALSFLLTAWLAGGFR